MKLLIYSHYFAPSIGGVESIVLSLARGLAELHTSANENQFEVTVVTQTPVGNFNDQALPFRIVRQPGLIRLWRLIRASDVIHIAGPALAPLALAKLARKPEVVEHHGYQAICPNGQLIHQPDGSMCPGHFQAKRYGECLRCEHLQRATLSSLSSVALMFPRYWLSRRAAWNLAITRHVMKRNALPRSLVVHYGVEPPAQRGPLHFPKGAASAGICFGYVGRLVSEKGIPTLLHAARILKEEGYEFQLRVVGDGPERPKLEALIDADHLGSCIRITGYRSGQDLAEAVRDIDVVVMPSICEETAGLAAIEQMMRGRLVIASDIGGLAEVVADAGLKCTPGSADALAECMRRVLLDPTLVDALGKKARDRALHLFARARMIEEHAHVYRTCFARAKPDA
jgi:glycogen synthase